MSIHAFSHGKSLVGCQKDFEIFTGAIDHRLLLSHNSPVIIHAYAIHTSNPYRRTLTQTGLVARMTVDPREDLPSILETILFPGRLGNKIPYLGHPLNQNTKLWPIPYLDLS
jgi:hypothetical protein